MSNMKPVNLTTACSLMSEQLYFAFIYDERYTDKASVGGQFPRQWPIRRTLQIPAKSTYLTTPHTYMDSRVIWSNKSVS